MRAYIIIFIFTLLNHESFCCINCNKKVQEGIFDNTFFPNFFIMLSAFIVLSILIFVLTRLATERYQVRIAANPTTRELTAIPLSSAAIILGMGIGGFIDGILLHQILQWHEMLTNKIPANSISNKSINMFWDGIFHSFTLLTSTIGIYLLWRSMNRKDVNHSGYLLIGGMLMGWGLFNLVEGIINHHIFKLHNVYEFSMNPDKWNYGFLLFGIFLLIAGRILMKKGETT
jgi:uncharacterized membrane protein